VRSAVIFALLLALQAVHAATVSISQPGADPGTVMKGRYFTITVSGLSGSGTATLILPTGVTVEEGTTKSFSSGSVSWTTAIASQTLTGQKVYVSISTAGSPVTAASDPFDIVLPPSLELSVYPASFVEPSGEKTLQLTIRNWGETTARDVSVRLSLPRGVSIATGSATQSIPTILGGTGGNGESRGISWVLSFDSPSNGSIEITVTPSNAETRSVSVPVVVYGATQTQPAGTGGGGGGGGGAAAELPNVKEIPKILSGSQYTVSFDSRLVPGLESVQIFAAADQYLTRLTVESFLRKPDWVNFAEPEGRVYIYYRMSYSKPETYVEKARIRFRVNESWLREQDINPEKLALYRLSSSRTWERLSTKPERAGDGYITFSALSPGFSWFAVAGEPGTGFRDVFAEEERSVQQLPEEEQAGAKAEAEQQPAELGAELQPPAPEEQPSAPAGEEGEKKRWICAPAAVLLALLPAVLGRRIRL